MTADGFRAITVSSWRHRRVKFDDPLRGPYAHVYEQHETHATYRAIVSLLLEPLLEPLHGALEAALPHIVAREVAAGLEGNIVRWLWTRAPHAKGWKSDDAQSHGHERAQAGRGAREDECWVDKQVGGKTGLLS